MKAINTNTNIIKYEKLNEVISYYKKINLDISDSYIYSVYTLNCFKPVIYYYLYIGKRNKSNYYFIPFNVEMFNTYNVFEINKAYYIIKNPVKTDKNNDIKLILNYHANELNNKIKEIRKR